MKIVICDDNQTDVNVLLKYLNKEHDVTIFNSAEEFLIDFESNISDVDLFVLDIFMKEMTGVSLATKIREFDTDVPICFTSSSSDFYREAYDLYAFQYLIKPIKENEFIQMINKVNEKVKINEKKINLSYKGKYVKIPMNQILFLESQGHTVYFYLKNGKVEKEIGQLDNYMKVLCEKRFFRTHQSYIINIYNVDELVKNYFVCEGHKVPISRKYMSVKDTYRKVLFEIMG